VSTDIESTISVFEVKSGQKVIQFINAHTTTSHGLKSVEITATCFVEKKTRLITGASDGTLKIWNFNNGQILRTMETEDNVEVTCIVFAKQCIFAAGWNKKVTVYVDGVDNEAVDPLTKVWPRKHNEDIISMTAHEGLHLLVTGSYDGEMIVWNYDTGYLLFRLDATKSRFPITVWSMMALKEMNQLESGKRLLDSQDNRQKSKVRSHQSLPVKQHRGEAGVGSAGKQHRGTKDKKLKKSDDHSSGSGSAARAAVGSAASSASAISPESGAGRGEPTGKSGIILPQLPKSITRGNSQVAELNPNGRPHSESIQSRMKNLKFEENQEAKSHLRSARCSKISACSNLKEDGSNTLPGQDNSHTCATVSIGIEEAASDTSLHVDSDKYNNSIEKLIFLTKREQSRSTATILAADSGGWIRGWSTHPQGGLVGQFRACYTEGAAVSCATTNESETMLFMGDSSGHVQIWDIEGWCEEGRKIRCSMEDDHDTLAQHPFFARFPFLLSIAKLRWKKYENGMMEVPEHLAPWETLVLPLRLNCWLAHSKGIVAIQFIDEKELVVTGSVFGTLRLWTIMGSFIGAFGQDKIIPWEIPESVKAPSEDEILEEVDPTDSWGSLVTPTNSQVQAAAEAKKEKTANRITTSRKVQSELIRIASSLSLRVYNQGSCPYWKYAKNIILIWCVRFAGTKVEDTHKHVEVETLDWDWRGVTPTSNVLGRTYHPVQRYKEPLDFNKLVRMQGQQLSVYHCVPLISTNAEKEEKPATPQCVMARQAEKDREAEILGGRKQMIKLPPIQ